MCGYLGCYRHWRCREASVNKEICAAFCSSSAFSEKKCFKCWGAVTLGGAEFWCGNHLVYSTIRDTCVHKVHLCIKFPHFIFLGIAISLTVLYMQVLRYHDMFGWILWKWALEKPLQFFVNLSKMWDIFTMFNGLCGLLYKSDSIESNDKEALLPFWILDRHVTRCLINSGSPLFEIVV